MRSSERAGTINEAASERISQIPTITAAAIFNGSPEANVAGAGERDSGSNTVATSSQRDVPVPSGGKNRPGLQELLPHRVSEALVSILMLIRLKRTKKEVKNC